MTRKIKKIKGKAEIVDEKQIFNSFKELANKGFFVEPSSAVAYAAYKKHLKKGEISKEEKTVIILTGNGLKTRLEP
jgi:threonine synthase